MRATNKLDRAGRAACWVAVAVLATVVAGLTDCVTTPTYPGYGAGYGTGYAAGSNAYDNSVAPTTYGSSYDSYDAGAPQPYPQQSAPACSQPQPTYSQPNYSPYPSNGGPSYQAPADNRCGVIEYVETVPVRGQSGGMGAVLGGVMGGLLGHQVGGGRGNTVAIIGDAVAGTMAGNAVEGNAMVGQTYRMTMQLNDNSYITLTQDSPSGLHVRDHVCIENNMAMPYQPLPTWEHPHRLQRWHESADIAEAITPR